MHPDHLNGAALIGITDRNYGNYGDSALNFMQAAAGNPNSVI
jgi:hypothetical protein